MQNLRWIGGKPQRPVDFPPPALAAGERRTHLGEKRIVRTGNGAEELVVRVMVLEGVDEDTAEVLEEEFIQLSLDETPATQEQLQAWIDEKKAALETRAANKQRINVNAIT